MIKDVYTRLLCSEYLTVTVFGNKVFKGVIKLNKVLRVGPNPI